MAENTKSTFLQIRLDVALRDEFKEVCSNEAVNPSALIRKWITDYINSKKDQK